jgi:dienelactone hydrolase
MLFLAGAIPLGCGGGSSSAPADSPREQRPRPAPILRGEAPTFASASTLGSYQSASYAADASVRETRAYDTSSAHIYYPTDAEPPFAALAIVPGYSSPESSIADWAPFLASWGFVVMTIGTSDPETGAPDVSVRPPVRAEALWDALRTIACENTRASSPLCGRVDLDCLGVAGWSMGGGGALMAASAHPSILGAFAMAPWNDSIDYSRNTVPSLLFGGQLDGFVSNAMLDEQYRSLPAETPRLMYVVRNGDHFVANSPTDAATDHAPDGESTPAVARLGLSWMKVFLECDDRFRPFLGQQPANASDFRAGGL